MKIAMDISPISKRSTSAHKVRGVGSYINLLIEILPHILKKVPNARLIIAGWGSEAPLISDMIMKSKERRNIDIIGPVSEKEKRYLLARSWVFVNPSLHEGWGNSITEANLHGTPAVAFNVPGLSDAIVNAETGFLCRDRDDMVEKVCKIIMDGKLRAKMSKHASARAKSFNWEGAAEASLRILKKLSRKI